MKSLLVVTLCACGRVSFDPVGDPTGDGGNDADATVFGTSWTRIATATTRAWIKRVAVAPNGSVAVTGEYAGDLDAFGNPHPASNTAMFVGVLDVDGNRLWSEAYGGSAVVDGRDLGFDAAGNLFVHGLNTGVAMYGATQHDAGNGQDPILLSFAPAGSLATARWFTSTGANAQGRGLAMLPSGDAVVAGSFEGSLTIGSVNYADTPGMASYVARIAPASAPWVTSFTTTGLRIAVNDVDVADDDDDACIAGDFDGTATLGTQMITASGVSDAFVAKVDGSTVLWAKSIGTAASEVGAAVLETADGDCVVVGNTAGAIDFGAGPQQNFGNLDGFAARYGAGGVLRWGYVFGSASGDVASAAAETAEGDIIVTGGFTGTATFVDGQLTAQGNADGYVFALSATGQQRWLRALGQGSGMASTQPHGVAVDRQRRAIVIGGQVHGTVSFPDMTSTASFASFVHRFLY